MSRGGAERPRQAVSLPAAARLPGASGRRAPTALWLTAAALALLAVTGTAMVYGMLQLMSGGRAYVHGESRWSEAQQTAVFQLDRYAETGAPRYLSEARRALRVPLGDRQARLALSGPAYDYERAYQGLAQGQNHPDDIPAMIWLFEHFENAPYFGQAIDYWARADAHIMRLEALADRLEQAWRPPRPDPAALDALRRELAGVDRRLRPLEHDFSRVLGEGLRALKTVFMVTSLVVFVIMVIGILLLFRWTVRHIADSERRFWATIEHAPVGVAVVDTGGAFNHLNDTFCATLGYAREKLRRLTLADILAPDGDTDAAGLLRRAARAGEASVTVETRCLRPSGDALWCKLNLAPLPGRQGPRELIAVLEDVSEARRLSEKLSYEAAHDPLTGLLNRRRFETELEEALEHTRARGLVHTIGFTDLNRFKYVNDTAGHLAGDRLLARVAETLQGGMRSNDTLARIGGDELGFILHGCNIERGRQMAERLRRAVCDIDFEWRGERFEISTSIGLVEVSGANASPVLVMQAADQACYLAKQDHRGGIYVHTGTLCEAAPPGESRDN